MKSVPPHVPVSFRAFFSPIPRMPIVSSGLARDILIAFFGKIQIPCHGTILPDNPPIGNKMCANTPSYWDKGNE